MATGTVKSFNRSKGYGFIRMDSGGKDVFVHLSAVQEAGLADLRKGQKLSFEMFDNRGKAAAKNLRVSSRTTKGAAEHKLVSIRSRVTQNARCEMSKSELQQLKAKRTSVSRAALELAIAEAVRASDPQCEGLVEIFVEQVFPTSPDDYNWAIKGVKYGRAERDRCNAAISDFVKEGQREFEVSDFSK